MSAFNLRRFSNPECLRAIHPRHLVTFLRPFENFLTNRGLSLPAEPSAESIDYDTLIGILMDPGTDTPREMVDALYYVHEMSTDEGMDALIDAAAAASLELAVHPDQSPADLALQVWALSPDLVQEKHAEQFVSSRRSFDYYQSKALRRPKFESPSRDVLDSLECDLNDWFEKKHRGCDPRVFPFPKDDGVWFLIRHGSPYRREGVLRNGKPEGVHFRPLKFDVLIYDPRIGEIRINAGSVGEKSLYREQFGKHLFGDPDYFPDVNKYDLEPLRRDGKTSLVCVDVPGMEWVRLKEIHFFRGGAYGEIEIRKASDVFAAYMQRGHELPKQPRILLAVFEVKFEDDRRPRSVTIKPRNVAKYTRDADGAMIEEWLTKRGFIRSPEHAADATPGQALASA
ncbi:MAG: hypothetical protein HOP29_07435 [Phycisphaerales bacterium]|nr:hypothetical protein [Phycisphaerales bacterium]